MQGFLIHSESIKLSTGLWAGMYDGGYDDVWNMGEFIRGKRDFTALSDCRKTNKRRCHRRKRVPCNGSVCSSPNFARNHRCDATPPPASSGASKNHAFSVWIIKHRCLRNALYGAADSAPSPSNRLHRGDALWSKNCLLSLTEYYVSETHHRGMLHCSVWLGTHRNATATRWGNWNGDCRIR